MSKRESQAEFFAKLDALLLPTVHEVNRLTPTIIEIVVKAPLAAREFRPGQFYRLQNYDGEIPSMEGIALTGASVDKEKGLLSLITLEMGGSSSLCQYLKKGEPVVIMGPTGTPTEIKGGENVLLVGGGLGNAVLFSIGKAFREAGSKVLYFAGYKRKIDRFKTEDIEAAADQVIWCCEEDVLDVSRKQDATYHGNVVEAMSYHADLLRNINRVIAIGSDGMMDAVNKARKHQLPKTCVAIASINSPMQCMMKEICGQCLQKHIDPLTGVETYVYSCTTQDQDMNHVDFAHLKKRLNQNSLTEKLTKKWLEHTIAKRHLSF